MNIKIKWFPRSWVQIIIDKKVLYIDPAYLPSYFKQYPHCTSKDDNGLPEVLPHADIILVTHAHRDHCKIETIKQLSNEKTQIFAPKNCHKILGSNYYEVEINQEYQVDLFTIKTTAAYNTETGQSTRKVHKYSKCVGYIISFNNLNIYHAGDTDLIDEMSQLGTIDIAFLPIGGTFTMNIMEAIKATTMINPNLVIPIHHLYQDPYVFKLQLETSTKHKAKIMEIGESVEISIIV